LTRLIGTSLTKDLIFGSRLLTHKEAHDLGIVQHIGEEKDESRLVEMGFEMGEDGNGSGGREGLGRAFECAERWSKNGESGLTSRRGKG